MSPLARGLAGVLLLAAGPTARAQTRVAPPDPADLDRPVRAAVAELTGIVARRDLAALKRHMTAETKVSFGGDAGPQGLDTVWEPERADTALWRELTTILALGGVQAEEDGVPTWCAPYPACMPIDRTGTLTGYDYVVATGSDIAVRAAPGVEAALLGRVSHEALVLADAEQDSWWAVHWRGRTGYVRADLARSPVDYRITLDVAPDGWRIRWFVGGD